MKRFGQVIGVKPEHFDAYKKYHAAVWPEILEKIKDCHIKNYSIFHKNGFLFAYFEYDGEDFAKDMQKMAAEYGYEFKRKNNRSFENTPTERPPCWCGASNKFWQKAKKEITN